MKTIILCGNTSVVRGNALCPKPLVELAQKPILLHIMSRYALFGFREFILCIDGNSNDNAVAKYLNTFDWPKGISISMIDTGSTAETGSRILKVQECISDDTFMVTFGDGLADIDIRQLVRFHHMHGKIATVSTVLPQHRIQTTTYLNERDVKQMEKERVDSWVTAGFFVFHRKVFSYFDGTTCKLGTLPMDRLAGAGELVAYRHTGFYITADSVESLDHPREHGGLVRNMASTLFS
jgi:glucose-1-phosphate cytidylyltransferase